MNKHNNITFIHVIAAYMVAFGHQFDLLDMHHQLILGSQFHGFGRDILFLLSGYLVTASYLRIPKRSAFLIKRFFRLYPPLVVCIILTVLIMKLFSNAGEWYDKSAYIYIHDNLLMRPRFDLAGVFTNNPYAGSVNGSLWTIPLECACYVLLIPILDVFRKINSKNRALQYGVAAVCLAFVIIGIPLYQMIQSRPQVIVWGTDWFSGIPLLCWFMAGSFLYLLDAAKWCSLQLAVIVGVIYACSAGFMKGFIAPIAIIFFVMGFANSKEPICAKLFQNSDICYEIYLYAFPVQQIIIDILYVRAGWRGSVYSYFIISMVITTGIAILIRRFIHKPMEKGLSWVTARVTKLLYARNRTNTDSDVM